MYGALLMSVLSLSANSQVQPVLISTRARLVQSATEEAVPTPKLMTQEFRGVWVATVDNIDWPSTRTLTTEKQQQELLAIFDTCKAMHLNAVILQVRPSADALYNSKLEPWSAYLTNEQGKAPNPAWDPLEFAVKQAHQRGLELHCWFNPYRATHPVQKSPNAKTHISNQHPEVVKKYGTYEWMDPGEPFVQQRSIDVMLDVVKRYDVDGVHIDDYFYPYPVNDANKTKIDFPDEKSFAKYVAAGGKLKKPDWRRKNVDDFIERLYKGIKKVRRSVKFGISPFGVYRPGIPEGIRSGVDQYDELYADARKWLVEGWCDYFTPQLYWPIKQTPQSYPVLYDWWRSQNPKNRYIWPGNFTGRTDPSEGNWKPQEVIDQIGITRKPGPGTGNVHFSMKAFMRNSNGIKSALVSGVYANESIVPPSPWLGEEKPKAPDVKIQHSTDKMTIEISGPKDPRFFAVSILVQKTVGLAQKVYQWTEWTRSSVSKFSCVKIEGEQPLKVAVIAYSKTGVPSEISFASCTKPD